MDPNLKCILEDAKNLKILNDHSEAIFEDVVKHCQSQVAMLRKQQSEINGKIIQLMLTESLIHSIIKSHVNQKIEDNLRKEQEASTEQIESLKIPENKPEEISKELPKTKDSIRRRR
jgi:hypothetical protein